jgi:serine/threonine protein kinase HipA of HipAB toxin-antitoxin module
MRAATQQPNRVAAVFQNAAVGLEVGRQTTLAQLAEQLSALAEVHGKLMLPVQVRVATAPSSMPGNRYSRHIAR